MEILISPVETMVNGVHLPFVFLKMDLKLQVDVCGRMMRCQVFSMATDRMTTIWDCSSMVKPVDMTTLHAIQVSLSIRVSKQK